MKTIAMLSLAPTIMTSACWNLSSLTASQVINDNQNIMNYKSANILFKSVTLLAREERQPPLGQLPINNRDIGFASVLIRLENTKVEEATIIIKYIKIRNLSDGTLQNFSHPSKEIKLKPLENTELAFQMTNKSGYSGSDKVIAVITYQIGDRLYIIQSEPVEFDKL